MTSNPEKSMHPMFQVVSFFKSGFCQEHNLSSDEQTMLLILASYQGEKGIFPCINTLARDTNKNHRNTRHTLQRLQEKGLISTDRTLGKSSHYSINLVTENNEKLSTTQVVHDHITYPQPRSCTTQGIGRVRPRTQVVYDLQSDNYNNLKEKRESALPNFSPNEEHIKFAQDSGIDLEKELESFGNLHKGEKNKFSFMRWLQGAVNYRERKATVPAAKNNEVRSTVKFWGPGHEQWEAMHAQVPAARHMEVTGNGNNATGNTEADNGRREGGVKPASSLFSRGGMGLFAGKPGGNNADNAQQFRKPILPGGGESGLAANNRRLHAPRHG